MKCIADGLGGQTGIVPNFSTGRGLLRVGGGEHDGGLTAAPSHYRISCGADRRVRAVDIRRQPDGRSIPRSKSSPETLAAGLRMLAGGRDET
jgi:hypothetical protein